MAGVAHAVALTLQPQGKEQVAVVLEAVLPRPGALPSDETSVRPPRDKRGKAAAIQGRGRHFTPLHRHVRRAPLP